MSYPYSDHHQMPPSRTPWVQGCELWEAYGRFLDRCRTGRFEDVLDGWAFNGRVDAFQDGSGYDADFGYTEESQIEAHKQREIAKLSRSTGVDRRASHSTAARHKKNAAQKAWKADLLSLLRKCGKLTNRQIEGMLGKPPQSLTTTILSQFRGKGLVQSARPPGKRKGKDHGSLRWSLKQTI